MRKNMFKGFLKNTCKVKCRGYRAKRGLNKNRPPVQGSAVQILRTGVETGSEDTESSNLSIAESNCSVKIGKMTAEKKFGINPSKRKNNRKSKKVY